MNDAWFAVLVAFLAVVGFHTIASAALQRLIDRLAR